MGSGDWIQFLMLARQAIYKLRYPPTPFQVTSARVPAKGDITVHQMVSDKDGGIFELMYFNYNLAFRLWSRKIKTWECKNRTFSYFQTFYRCYSCAFWFWRNDIIFWKYIIIEWVGLSYSCLTSFLFLFLWMLGDLSRQAVRYDPVPTL